MVAVPELDTLDRVSPRLLRMLREIEVPGDETDHVWMGRQLQAAAAKLTGRFPDRFCQDLLVSGLALHLGLDPAGSGELQEVCFPETWLSTVPVLLQCGFPAASWHLVENGLLSYEASATDVPYGWRLDLTRILKQTHPFYELGSDLLTRRLQEGVEGICHARERDTRIRIQAGSLSESREWVKRLKTSWRTVSRYEMPLLVAG